jgi:phage/plasmid-associated DNA primase
MTLSDFLSLLKNVSRCSGGWKACCPAHEDHSPSLSISEGTDGRILVKCHAGCTTEQVVAAMRLSLSDLFPDSGMTDSFNLPELSRKSAKAAQHRSKKPMRKTSFHPYSKGGQIVAGVFRFDPADGSDGKQYVPVHSTPSGGAVGDPPGGWPVYRLEDIQQHLDDPVFLVEGEKAADALAELGLTVTTSAHGSNAWKKTDWSPLVGRDLIVMPDNDEAGRKYISSVVSHLHELGGTQSLRRIDLSHLAAKADAYDLIAVLREEGLSDGQIRSELQAMAEEWDFILSNAEGSPELTLMKKLTKNYGDAFSRGSKGQPVSVNQQFAAGWCAQTLDLLFDPSLQCFYEYDPPSGLWMQRSDAVVIQRIGEALGRMLSLLSAVYLRSKCGQAVLSAVAGLLKGMVEEQGVWKKQDHLIHLANGMLRIDAAGSLHLCSFSTRYYSRNRSSYPWKPEARCPRFLSELIEPALSADDILLLRKYAGQCLLGRNASQTLLLIRGTAGGGKSTLCEIIENIIGEKNVSQLRVEQLTNRFESSRFLGRTLLSGKDVAGSFLDSKGAYVLKSLVGGDRLEGEVKGGNLPVSIRGEFNSIITSNSRLCVRLDGDAAAWRRRLLIIDFDQPPVEKRIPFFASRLLEEEGAGILHWMIDGAVALLADLSQLGCVRLSEQQIRRVEDLLAESDSVRAFVRDCIETADPHSTITVAELTAAYFDYCDSRGWEARSRRRFETAAADVMMEIHRTARRNDIQRDGKNQRGYSRVRLVGQTPNHGDTLC